MITNWDLASSEILGYTEEVRGKIDGLPNGNWLTPTGFPDDGVGLQRHSNAVTERGYQPELRG